MWSVGCGLERGMWRMGCEVWDVKCGMCGRCGVSSVECGCGVWSVECGVWLTFVH